MRLYTDDVSIVVSIFKDATDDTFLISEEIVHFEQ